MPIRPAVSAAAVATSAADRPSVRLPLGPRSLPATPASPAEVPTWSLPFAPVPAVATKSSLPLFGPSQADRRPCKSRFLVGLWLRVGFVAESRNDGLGDDLERPAGDLRRLA